MMINVTNFSHLCSWKPFFLTICQNISFYISIISITQSVLYQWLILVSLNQMQVENCFWEKVNVVAPNWWIGQVLEQENSETRVPVSRPKRPKSKSQHRDWYRDYESYSLSDKTETINLIVSVFWQRLRPTIIVSRARLRPRPRLKENNCDGLWPDTRPWMEIP